MTVPVLSTQDSLEVIRTEIVFTLAALRANTRGSKCVAMMEPLLPEWAKVSAQELLLRDAKTTASAAITAANNQLNPCIDQVAALVLREQRTSARMSCTSATLAADARATSSDRRWRKRWQWCEPGFLP
jgi:hypothetical protein